MNVQVSAVWRCGNGSGKGTVLVRCVRVNTLPVIFAVDNPLVVPRIGTKLPCIQLEARSPYIKILGKQLHRLLSIGYAAKQPTQ